MTTYWMEIEGGDGGRATVEADSIDEAMEMAMEWAAEGDWSGAQEGTEESYGGCGAPVAVRVWSEDGDEERTDHYEIPTLGDLRERELEDGGEVLAEDEGEFSTRRIVRVGEDLYYQIANGGSRGAYDRQCGDGVWRDSPVEPTRLIDRREAVARLLDWGHAPAEAARLVGRTDERQRHRWRARGLRLAESCPGDHGRHQRSRGVETNE